VRTRHVCNTSAANGDLLIMSQPGQTRETSDSSRSGPLEKLRDVTYGEDASQTRTGNGPQVMATLICRGTGVRGAGLMRSATQTRLVRIWLDPGQLAKPDARRAITAEQWRCC